LPERSSNTTAPGERSDGDFQYWVALNQVPGMAAERFYRLIERFGSASSVWNAPESDINRCDLLTPAIRDSIKSLRRSEDGSQELDRAAESGASVVCLTSTGYPEPLTGVPFPPPVLYIKGQWDVRDSWAVAVVGTRSCTGYGRDTASELSRRLASRGFTIVSGLAKGIDSSAHQGALHAGGRTIAVFGTDINTIYPPENRKLAGDITENGAIVSEFPIGIKPEKYFFPRRNAIISGLSMGVIVVEAGKKSGALITAEKANEQSREIFAVPGDINTGGTRGPHWLIKHGAHLVESDRDVVDILGEPRGQEELELEESAGDEEHEKVLGILGEGPRNFDEICAALDRTASETSTILMMMELKGSVRQLPGKVFIRN